MSGAEEAGGGVPAAGPAGAVPAGVGVGVGVGAAAGPAAAALGEAAGPGLPDEAGLAGVRQLQEAAGDPDAPPKKRLRAAEAAEAAAAAAGSGKLEERLYSVLCCTVCLDLPKASVYQVGPPARPRPGPAPAPPRPAPRSPRLLGGQARAPSLGPSGRESGARSESPYSPVRILFNAYNILLVLFFCLNCYFPLRCFFSSASFVAPSALPVPPSPADRREN